MMDANSDSQSPRLIALEHWLIRCDSCGFVDQTHQFSDSGGYGRALGRTCWGELAEFNGWQDPVYEELLAIVRAFMPHAGDKRADCFNRVMGLAADPAPSGERYQFIDGLCCRQCRSTARWYKPGEPFPLVEQVPVPLVTHHEWASKSDHEKGVRVAEALRSFGCL